MADKAKFHSLGRSMIMWFLLMGLVPLGLVSLFGYQQAYTNLVEDAEGDLKDSAELSVRFINNWFEYRLADLTTQAKSNDNIILLEQLIKGQQQSGKSPIDYVKSDDWELRADDANNNLITFGRHYDYVYDLFLIDKDGNILYSVAHESDLGTNLLDGPYAETEFAGAVKNTLETGDVRFSGIERYAPSNDIFAGFITAPVIDDRGNRIGVFAIQLRLDQIFDLLHSSGDDSSSLTHYLVDKEGRLQTPLGVNWNDVLVRKVNMENLSLLQNVSGEFVIDTKEPVSEYIGPTGATVLGSHHLIKLANINWVLITETNRDEVLATAGRLRKLILLVIALTTVFLTFLAIYLARRITQPIASLADASMSVAAGEINQQVEVGANNEIGRLAEAFNHMLQMRQFHEEALEQSAKESQKSLEELAEQKFALDQHAIVAITDAGGTITFANEKFSELSGYSHEELIGQNHRMLNSGYHDKAFFTEMFKTISSGTVWNAEVCNRANDGSLYWVDTTIVPFIGDHGPERYVAIRTDVTERKLTEDALIEAKVEAEAAVLAKGEFLASMSHEIRTPMNGVLGMLGLLMKTKLDSEQHHRASIAQSSAQSLLTLINDILDFSKVEAGKLDLEMIDFKLHCMLGEFAEGMALQAQSKGLELILDLTRVDQTMVKGDPGRLRQILTNLVSNAIKFTAEGEVIIRVELQESDDQHWRLAATVTDTGIGIPADKIEALFDSFSQVDASTTRKYGGTGLGLSIVKKLCELMGGEVKASSEPGEGSCFDMYILIEKSSQSQKAVPQVEMQSLNFLVVDDNATNRGVLRSQLEQWGANVVVAESGKQALEICEDRIQRSDQAFFDIALLDMKMPEMDGVELGQAFKSNHRFSDMKLVIMTPIESHGDTQNFARTGFSSYFPKPATTIDLCEALAVITDGSETLQQDDHNQKGEQENDDLFESTIGQTEWPLNTRILLVEDNQINQLVAKGILKGFGLQVDVAENGVEALEKFNQADKKELYQLVLMDCEMPIMDGYETTREIRTGNAGEQNKEIPIVAMTANVMQGIREKCMEAGMDDYLAKPIEPGLLVSKLQDWLLVDNSDQKVIEKMEPSTSEPEPNVWDKESALKRLMGDEELLVTVLDAFISDIPVRLVDLQQALDAKDYDTARRSAHSIKGVAGNLGGLSLQQQATLMEDAAKEKDMDQLIRLMPVLQQAQQQLMECFMHFKEQSKSDYEADQVLQLDDEKLIDRLHALEVRLRESDFIDPQELSPLKKTNLRSETQELLSQFVDQVSRFDNMMALKTLVQIAKIEEFNLLEEIQE